MKVTLTGLLPVVERNSLWNVGQEAQPQPTKRTQAAKVSEHEAVEV
jgi:hypothetical protein